MSVAGAKRRQIVSGYAHLGNALGRPIIHKGRGVKSVGEAIAAARRAAANEAKRSKKK